MSSSSERWMAVLNFLTKRTHRAHDLLEVSHHFSARWRVRIESEIHAILHLVVRVVEINRRILGSVGVVPLLFGGAEMRANAVVDLALDLVGARCPVELHGVTAHGGEREGCVQLANVFAKLFRLSCVGRQVLVQFRRNRW